MLFLLGVERAGGASVVLEALALVEADGGAVWGGADEEAGGSGRFSGALQFEVERFRDSAEAVFGAYVGGDDLVNVWADGVFDDCDADHLVAVIGADGFGSGIEVGLPAREKLLPKGWVALQLDRVVVGLECFASGTVHRFD